MVLVVASPWMFFSAYHAVATLPFGYLLAAGAVTTISRRRRAVGIAVLAVLVLGAPSHAALKEWDQDRVTELAIELSEASFELQRAFRRLPSSRTA